MGRPSKLTPALQAVVLRHIVRGNFREVAAGAVGIPPETFSRWMSRPGQPYEAFRQAVIEAEKLAEIKAVERLIAAGARNPEHLKWWLERKFPDRWGRKDRIDLTVIDRELERARDLFGLSDEETERLKALAVADAEAIVKGKRADHS